MDYSGMQAEIRRLAREKDAVILAHNYQRPEVQDVADILGDSLGLSRQAAASTGPDDRLLRRSLHGRDGGHPGSGPAGHPPRGRGPAAPWPTWSTWRGCRLSRPSTRTPWWSATSTPRRRSRRSPTSAAPAPTPCRSCGRSPPDREIIFTPDRNLGSWAAKKAGREVILWPGFCPTHDLIEVSDVEKARAAHPGAKVVVHPECRPEVTEIADAVESTSGMIRFCREDDAKEYLIGTELGMIYRLSQDFPGKRFYPVTEISVCPNMKLTTLDKVLRGAARTRAPWSPWSLRFGPRLFGPCSGWSRWGHESGPIGLPQFGSPHLPRRRRAPLLQLRRAGHRRRHRRADGGGGGCPQMERGPHHQGHARSDHHLPRPRGHRGGHGSVRFARAASRRTPWRPASASATSDAVRVLVEEGPARVRELEQLGTKFDRRDGKLILGSEGAHSVPRVVHAGGDATGSVVASALAEAITSGQPGRAARERVRPRPADGRRAAAWGRSPWTEKAS